MTPMMAQYQAIKNQYQDSILFYRMGDFYEMFCDDAVTASEVLGITLTRRGKNDAGDIPMCGVPYHSSETYLQKLMKSGYKIAICEQVESPEEAKKRGYKSVVKRQVVRVLTPGTITEDNLLDGKLHNYLACLTRIGDEFAISWVDISLLEFCTMICSVNSINSIFSMLNPQEILIADSLFHDSKLSNILQEWRKKVTLQVASFFDGKKAENKLKQYYNIAFLDSFGDHKPAQIAGCGAILEYLSLTQIDSMPKLPRPKLVNHQLYMEIDSYTRRNLEISQSVHNTKSGSLLYELSHIVTSMGARLLAQYLAAPLLDQTVINHRLDAVEFFYNNSDAINKLRAILKFMPDLERSMGRISINRASPRDLLAVKNGLLLANQVRHLGFSAPILQRELANFRGFSELIAELECALRDEVPVDANDGGFIRLGYDEELDGLLNIEAKTRGHLSELKYKYCELTGIPNLKIAHNNVLGYFIEVTPSQVSKMDHEIFIHRQTLTTCTRYTTEELKQIEQRLINAQDNALKIELGIFSYLIQKVTIASEIISILCYSVASLDVWSNFGLLARDRGFVRPIIDSSSNFIVRSGRHMVIESALKEQNKSFMANDCNLSDRQNIWLLTGPNMAGKSTFLRQNALIAIMAQIGSFVPADFAHIGIIDRVFSRIGASDDLASGRSTFMVEMIETATILNHATKNSLVILDEIGRGTSTYDGVSIAWSCLEYLYQDIKCKTLFATHYHELSDLSTKLPDLQFYNMAIKEWNDTIIFLHKIVPGSVDHSYGLHVAKLAGMPEKVMLRAEQVLKILEENR